MIHHGAANGLAVRRPVEFRDDPAAGHDADTVGEGQHLVEIFADEHHGGAAVARRQQALMHGVAGSRVKAAARAMGDHDGGAAAEFAGDDELLRVAAR